MRQVEIQTRYDYARTKIICPAYAGEKIDDLAGKFVEIRQADMELYNTLYFATSELLCGGLVLQKATNTVSVSGDSGQPEISGYEFRHEGKSGIASRNLWTATLPTTIQPVIVVTVESMFSDGKGEISEGFAEVCDLAERQRVLESARIFQLNFKAEKSKKEIEKRMRAFDAVEISEFNKAPFFGLVPAGLHGIIIKTTTCGNTTACIVRAQKNIHVPENLKGVVIGKAGKNIKRLSEIVGSRVNIIL